MKKQRESCILKVEKKRKKKLTRKKAHNQTHTYIDVKIKTENIKVINKQKIQKRHDKIAIKNLKKK